MNNFLFATAVIATFVAANWVYNALRDGNPTILPYLAIVIFVGLIAGYILRRRNH